MPPRSNNWDSFNIAIAMGDDEHGLASTSWYGQAESANYSYSELSYVSAKLYRSSVRLRLTVHCTGRDLSRSSAAKTVHCMQDALTLSYMFAPMLLV